MKRSQISLRLWVFKSARSMTTLKVCDTDLLWSWQTKITMDLTSKVCWSTLFTTSGQLYCTSMGSLKSLWRQFWKYREVLKLFKASSQYLSTKIGRKEKISSLSRLSTTKVWEHLLQKRLKIIFKKSTHTRSSSSTTTTKMMKRSNLHLPRNSLISAKNGLNHMIQSPPLLIIQFSS